MTGPEYIQEAIKNHGFIPDTSCPYCEESNSDMHLCKKSGLNLQDPNRFIEKVINLFKKNL